MPTNAATQTDILARWAVYQELKPLYDIVDGAVGEVAMPRDVLEEYGRQVNAPNMSPHTWVLGREPHGWNR